MKIVFAVILLLVPGGLKSTGEIAEALRGHCGSFGPQARIHMTPIDGEVHGGFARGLFVQCLLPLEAPPPSAPRPNEAPERITAPEKGMVKIKQGRGESPLKVGAAPARKLEALCARAGALARAKQELAAEEAAVKEAFAELRGPIERGNGLGETYTVVGDGGAIQVSLGREFRLLEPYTHPVALQRKLEAMGRQDLQPLFRLEAIPDQRAIKNAMDEDVLKIGALVEKTPAVSLKAV